MKATTIILAAVLTLSMNVLFASNDGVGVNTESCSILNLAPSTPSEATFEDITQLTATFNLAPVTPSEADFPDVAPGSTNDFSILAPVTPSEADFSVDEIQTNITSNLAPITPAFADFSDSI